MRRACLRHKPLWPASYFPKCDWDRLYLHLYRDDIFVGLDLGDRRDIAQICSYLEPCLLRLTHTAFALYIQ